MALKIFTKEKKKNGRLIQFPTTVVTIEKGFSMNFFYGPLERVLTQKRGIEHLVRFYPWDPAILSESRDNYNNNISKASSSSFMHGRYISNYVDMDNGLTDKRTASSSSNRILADLQTVIVESGLKRNLLYSTHV